jgi:hypothetical protein
MLKWKSALANELAGCSSEMALRAFMYSDVNPKPVISDEKHKRNGQLMWPFKYFKHFYYTAKRHQRETPACESIKLMKPQKIARLVFGRNSSFSFITLARLDVVVREIYRLGMLARLRRPMRLPPID